MKTNWDVFIFNPLILIILFIVYILILAKNIKIKHTSQKAFFIQTFLYWFALSTIVGDNLEVRGVIVNLSLNNIEGIGIIAAISTSFYAFVAMIPYVFSQKFFSRFGWQVSQYLIFASSMLGIIVLMAYPTLATLIIASVLLGIGIITKASYFLSYNEVYGRKFFPFKTVSLIAPVMTFAYLFGTDFNSLVEVVGQNLSGHLQLIIVGSVALAALTFVVLLYAFFSRREFTSTQFTAEQQKMFEPFKWGRVLIIFFMFILIIFLKEMSQSNIYIWLLAQRTWEKYHNTLMVNQFIRLNEQLFLIPQFFGAYLACYLLYNKLGVKYCFGLGLLLWFVFFAIASFNHSPDAFLFLQIINGLAYAMCFNILFAMVCEWKYRAPKNQPIVAQFQLLFFGTEFATKFIDDVCRNQKVGIFSNYDFKQNYISIDNFAYKIDDITTIIFTCCAAVVLIIILLFYYTADYFLAEYRNHLRLLVPKINLLLKESFINRVKSNIAAETDDNNNS